MTTADLESEYKPSESYSLKKAISQLFYHSLKSQSKAEVFIQEIKPTILQRPPRTAEAKKRRSRIRLKPQSPSDHGKLIPFLCGAPMRPRQVILTPDASRAYLCSKGKEMKNSDIMPCLS